MVPHWTLVCPSLWVCCWARWTRSSVPLPSPSLPAVGHPRHALCSPESIHTRILYLMFSFFRFQKLSKFLSDRTMKCTVTSTGSWPNNFLSEKVFKYSVSTIHDVAFSGKVINDYVHISTRNCEVLIIQVSDLQYPSDLVRLECLIVFNTYQYNVFQES